MGLAMMGDKEVWGGNMKTYRMLLLALILLVGRVPFIVIGDEA